MSEQGYVDALWVGPAGFAHYDGTGLIPGETVVSIPKGEAESSDNWQPQGAAKTKTEKAGS